MPKYMCQLIISSDLVAVKSHELWGDMSPFLSFLGHVGLISLAVASATLKTRKYVPSVQENSVWPKLIYQTVEFNRMPSVRLKIVFFYMYCRMMIELGYILAHSVWQFLSQRWGKLCIICHKGYFLLPRSRVKKWDTPCVSTVWYGYSSLGTRLDSDETIIKIDQKFQLSSQLQTTWTWSPHHFS